MPKGIHNTPRGKKKSDSSMINSTLRLPKEVKDGLTTIEKRTILVDAHYEKMRDLSAWCDKMLNKLNSK